MKYLSYDGLKYVYGKILARINTRVEKEEGKGLSSNDYTDAETKELAEAGKLKHSHANKGVLDSVTQKMLEKLEGIAEGANKYVHPSTSGNKHIPSGGKSGQILGWEADGQAQWKNPETSSYTHPESGAAPGTYRSVTVDAKGHVTKGSNPTTLEGYGITDAIKKNAVTWADLNTTASVGVNESGE